MGDAVVQFLVIFQLAAMSKLDYAMSFGLLPDELIVDNFAGGGGASLGVEMALGRPPDVAINHDPEAIATRSGHPGSPEETPAPKV